MTNSPAENARIDCHAHVFSPSWPMAENRRYTPQSGGTLESYLALLDANGLTHGVLTAPSFLGTNNSYILDTILEAKGRLRCTVTVETNFDDDCLQRMADHGAVGIRFNWVDRKSIPDLSDPSYTTLLRRIEKLGCQVEFQIDSPWLTKILPPLRDAGVKVVIDHFGLPDPEAGIRCPGFKALLGALADGFTWVKVSAPFRVAFDDLRPFADEFLNAGGPQRMLWGSDWPWVRHEHKGITYAGLLEQFEVYVPDGEAREIILGKSAYELFGFSHPLVIAQ